MKRWLKRSMSTALTAAITISATVGMLNASVLAASPFESQHKTFTNDSFTYPTAPSGMSTLQEFKQKSWGVHDTEFLYDSATDTYYAYVTNSSEVRSSTDLINWTSAGSRTGRAWAPCIIELKTPINYNGVDYNYLAYDSSSSFGTNDSQITRYLSNSPYEGFVNAGTAIQSRNGTSPFNALDAKIFYDAEDNLWMSFGSWFSGIYIVPMDETTGLPEDGVIDEIIADENNHRVCYRNINHAAMEGSNVIYNPDTGYYYLNVSYDDMDSTYNVRIGRSKNPQGPYLDYNGQDLNNKTTSSTESWKVGTKITTPYYFEYDTGWYSTGHSSFIYNSDTNEYFISTNARASDIGGATKLNVRKIFWTEDGWPTVMPEQYTSETEQTVPTDLIPGVYQIIPILRESLPETTAECQRGNEVIELKADNTVTGSYSGYWAQTGEHTVKMLLNDVEYTLTVAAVWDWELGKPTLAFTGLSKAGDFNDDYAGIQLWGKQVDPEPLVQGSYDNLSLQSSTRLDLALPTSYYTGVNITWQSMNKEILNDDGTLNHRPTEDTYVLMVATLSLGDITMNKPFPVLVYADTVEEQSDPIAQYSFNDEANWLKDGSGENDLSYENSVNSYVAEGLLYGAANIAGDAMTAPEALANAEDFTFAGWVNMTTQTNNGKLFTIGSGDSIMTFTIRNNNNSASTINEGMQLVAKDNGINLTLTGPASAAPTLGDWAYVAVTLSGNTASIYYNGELVAQNTAFNLDPADISPKTFTIGDSNTKLLLDELSIYNIALSADEIASAYQAMLKAKTIKVLDDSINLAVGDTANTNANIYVYPNTISEKYNVLIRYASSDPSIAEVDSVTGEITAKAKGVATITATASGIGSATVTVNVTDAVVGTDLTISQDSATVKTGKTLQLAATITPENSTSKIVWSSDDESIATVSQTGLVTPISAGSATITATIDGTAIEKTCAVTVVDSLLVDYHFDGDLKDSSSYNRDVQTANGTYSYPDGVTVDPDDKALSIDEVKSGVGHVVRLQNNVISTSDNSQFSISVWVKPTALTAHTAVFFAQGQSRWMSIVPCSVDTGTPTVRICNDGDSSWSDITAADPIPLDEWSLLTYTFDSGSGGQNKAGTAKLYINGKLTASRSNADNPLNSRWGNTFYIGGNLWDTSFNGAIDNFRIYNIALNADQVKAIYNEVVPETYSLNVYHQYGDEAAVLDADQSKSGLSNGDAVSVKPVVKEGYEIASVEVDGMPWISGENIVGEIDGEDITITYHYNEVFVAPDPDEEDKEDTEDKPVESDPGKTGDPIEIGMIITLLLLSGSAVAIVKRKKIK